MSTNSTPEPVIGRHYATRPSTPYGVLTVTGLNRTWIFVEPGPGQERFQLDQYGQDAVPRRIKRKHWANKVVAIAKVAPREVIHR